MIKNLLTILIVMLGFYCQAQKILLLDKVGTGKRKRIFEKEIIHIRLHNGKHFQSPFMFSDDNKYLILSDTVVKLEAIDKVYSKGSKRMANVLTQTGKFGMIGSLIIFPFNGRSLSDQNVE